VRNALTMELKHALTHSMVPASRDDAEMKVARAEKRELRCRNR